VAVIVHDEDSFNSPPHSKIFIVVLQALETSGDRGIFLGLCFLGAETRNCRLRVDGMRAKVLPESEIGQWVPVARSAVSGVPTSQGRTVRLQSDSVRHGGSRGI